MTALYWWATTFGIWPLAHPEHDTWGDPFTWIDLMVHFVGLSVTLPLVARWAWRWAWSSEWTVKK